MEGARERAYAIRDGILYAVVSSRMNQVNELKSAQVGAPMSMGRAFKTRLRRRGVKQSGEIDIEFKIVEYTKNKRGRWGYAADAAVAVTGEGVDDGAVVLLLVVAHDGCDSRVVAVTLVARWRRGGEWLLAGYGGMDDNDNVGGVVEWRGDDESVVGWT
ncbi:hypothetical protein Tco_0172711 [Tanacetum coccineum]